MLAVIADPSQISEARRAAATLARASGFDDTGIARIALVATEMGTNLLKHAGRGHIIVSRFSEGIELLALDKGAGIANLRRSLADGFSTAGSAGTGLGAMHRQSDEFAIWSRPGLGTAVLARFQRNERVPRVALGALAEPLPGESVCGDGWRFADAAAGPTLLLVDGSGHGRLAAAAADLAGQTFAGLPEADCVRQMEAVHRALASTRGAAAAIARVDARAQLVRFVGLGNISAALVSRGAVKRMVSHNGTAGHVAARISEFTYPWNGGATLILHSDGLSAKWDLDAYPGLAASHPSLIAGVLFRDHRRDKDDASIVVLRVTP